MIPRRLLSTCVAALALATTIAAAPGTWTVEKVSAAAGTYDSPTLYGNGFTVGFTLKYTPGSGNMVEPPMLDWHEKFIMLDYGKSERWVYENNMYDLIPNSTTLIIWNKRYICAYADAETPDSLCSSGNKGFSKLRNLKDEPVPVKTLGAAKTDVEKADAVRKYLQKNGGFLLISINDIPSLNIPKAKTDHKKRLLLFDCGVVGGNLRAKGFQLVEVDGSKTDVKVSRECRATEATVKDLPLPTGFKEVEAPNEVRSARDKSMCPGCYM